MTCSRGPPCIPGKTPLSSNELKLRTAPFIVVNPQGLGKSLPIMMMPPRGPRKVLWWWKSPRDSAEGGCQASQPQSGRRVRNVARRISNLVGDGAEARVIPFAGVGGGAADDHLGLLFFAVAHLVHVDASGLLLHPVKGGR